jgi:sigma-B regulation protein RsbU (phosphoserine phosphatase)
VTLFFYVIDPLTGKIFFINGGHEPVFIVGKHGIKKSLTAVGPALGPIQGANYKIGTSQLETGDILFGYTDGVTEARSETKQLYTRARLEKILNKGHAGSAENFLAMIKTDLLEFTKNAPQSDDITMLAVKWEPGTIST